MKKGSITPFCACSLLFVSALLFALLELARISVLDTYAELKAENGMDSLCAEYHPFLWKQYGLLFLDGAYGTEEFSMNYVSEELEKQINESLDGYSFSASKICLEDYALAGDRNGSLFLHYIAEREKENLLLGVAEDLYQLYVQTEEVELEYGGVEEDIQEAKSIFYDIKADWQAKVDALWKKKETEKDSTEEIEIWIPDTSPIENTWNVVEQMQESSILHIIFEDMSELSQKKSKVESRMQTRKKESGTMNVIIEENWYQKMLVLAYLEEYFSCYMQNQKEHFLDYEMEYVLCAEETEWKNLEGALKRILFIREAANMAYLVQDEEKMAFAQTLANLIGLMAGENPAVVKVIQAGIVGAWAYLESVLDVRALIAGEVIPLIKQEGEWTTEVTNLFAVFDKNAKAKVCENGLSYRDYLKKLLFMTSSEELAYRMMEVMEMGMQSQSEYLNCRMDHMLVALNYQIQFECKTLFSSLIPSQNAYKGKMFFKKEVQRSYIP